MNDKISDKDKKDWENFLSDKSKIPNKDLNISQQNIVKTKTFDFHGFSLDEANETIDGIIKEPLGGAHREKNFILQNLRASIKKNLELFQTMSPDDIKQAKKNHAKKRQIIRQQKNKCKNKNKFYENEMM